MRYIALFLAILAPIALVACSSGPTDEEIRAIVRAEVQAAIAEVKQGPPGEQGPPPSEQQLNILITTWFLARKETFRGPQGLRGEQGPQGVPGPQGIPGTAELSVRDKARLNKVDSLEYALYGSQDVLSRSVNDIGGLEGGIARIHNVLDALVDEAGPSLCRKVGGTWFRSYLLTSTCSVPW